MALVIEKPDPKKKGVRPNVAAARLDYLHGVDGKNPNRTVKGLSEAHGMNPHTVRKWLPTWEKELEQITTSSKINEQGISLSGVGKLAVSPEVFSTHKTDIDFIRNELDDIKNQMAHLGETTIKLENMVETLSEKDMDKGLRLFENYLRACANKASLQKRFMTLQPLWSKLVGIDSVMEIQVAGAKAASVAQARAGSNDSEEKDSEELVVGFKKRR